MNRIRFFLTLIATAILSGVAATQIAAARTFELTSASIADINAAFEVGALTSEKLTQLYPARIEAYDKRGPKLNAVLMLNPRVG